MLCQYFQDPVDCSFMFLFHLREDQNVVQVYHYDPFGYESSENVVHHSLEGGGTVGHSEEHHERLEETAVDAEGHFPFISGLDTYVIETLSDIEFCEVLGSAERVQKGIAYWDKQNHAVPAPNCMLKVRGEIIKDKGL